MKKTILMLFLVFSSIIYGQTEKIKISGKLVDENNQPLPGATILVKGTNNGTVTDFDGSYSILVGNENSMLIFTFIGYDQKEIAVGNQTTINVKLTPTNNTLNEVVVVGYGTQKKSDVTGSVTS